MNYIININTWNIHDYLKTHKVMFILAVEVKGWDWKRLRKQDWEEGLKGLKKQDWIDWEDKIGERLHQSYQSSSIWKYKKLSINKLKNINRWNVTLYQKK